MEDNPCDAELTIRAIRKRNIANTVSVLVDGAEALDFIFRRGAFAHRDVSQPPKVIILDLKLPKVSGLDVLKAIKVEESTRGIPVVILTSSQEDSDIRNAYALGANSYVVKPVTSEVFTDTIGNLGLYWLTVNEPPK